MDQTCSKAAAPSRCCLLNTSAARSFALIRVCDFSCRWRSSVQMWEYQWTAFSLSRITTRKSTRTVKWTRCSSLLWRTSSTSETTSSDSAQFHRSDEYLAARAACQHEKRTIWNIFKISTCLGIHFRIHTASYLIQWNTSKYWFESCVMFSFCLNELTWHKYHRVNNWKHH